MFTALASLLPGGVVSGAPKLNPFELLIVKKRRVDGTAER